MNDFLSSLTTDEQGAYLITSAEYLKNFATYVNAGNNCEGLTFKLTSDNVLLVSTKLKLRKGLRRLTANLQSLLQEILLLIFASV